MSERRAFRLLTVEELTSEPVAPDLARSLDRDALRQLRHRDRDRRDPKTGLFVLEPGRKANAKPDCARKTLAQLD